MTLRVDKIVNGFLREKSSRLVPPTLRSRQLSIICFSTSRKLACVRSQWASTDDEEGAASTVILQPSLTTNKRLVSRFILPGKLCPREDESSNFFVQKPNR